MQWLAGYRADMSQPYKPFQEPDGTWAVIDIRTNQAAEMGSRNVVGMNQLDAEEFADLLNKLVALMAGSKNMNVKDSNGTPLSEGISVTLIKDLKVKGTSVTLKRGTLVPG